VLHINRYPAWPDGTRKKQSGFGPFSGTLIEKYDARYALDPNDLAVAGNPWGVPEFLWIDPDATTPTLGPVGTNLVATGAPVPGQPTPYQYPSAVDATAEEYDGASYRLDTVRRIATSDTNDIVVAVKFLAGTVVAGGVQHYMFGTTGYRDGDGFYMTYLNQNVLFYFNKYSVFNEKYVVCGARFPRTWNIAIAVVDRSATTMTGFMNSVVGTTNNLVPAGFAPSGGGIGIARAPTLAGNILDVGSRIEWIAEWNGADIYDAWRADSDRLINRLSMEALGLRETEANKVAGVNKYWMYSASGGGSGNHSGRSYVDHNNRWWLSSRYGPRAGNPNGLLLSSYENNQAVNSGEPYNFYPLTTTGWTATGGVFSVVADAAALAAVNAQCWGPNVFQFANATGAPQVVYMGADRAVAQHTFMVMGRYSAGANALIGWRDTSSGVFTSVGTILGGYALTTIRDQTPPSADQKFAIQIPDGCTLLFIAQDLSWDYSGLGLGHFKYPLPYRETPWNTQAQREIATTEHVPAALSGSYRICVAPTCWSGADIGAITDIAGGVTSGYVLQANTPAGWYTTDGTTAIQTVAPYVPAVGVYVDVWSAWRGLFQYIQEGLAAPSLVTGAYDGNKGLVGALRAAASLYGGEVAVKWIEIRQV
jgi:hypothetical protein